MKTLLPQNDREIHAAIQNSMKMKALRQYIEGLLSAHGIDANYTVSVDIVRKKPEPPPLKLVQ